MYSVRPPLEDELLLGLAHAVQLLYGLHYLGVEGLGQAVPHLLSRVGGMYGTLDCTCFMPSSSWATCSCRYSILCCSLVFSPASLSRSPCSTVQYREHCSRDRPALC